MACKVQGRIFPPPNPTSVPEPLVMRAAAVKASVGRPWLPSTASLSGDRCHLERGALLQPTTTFRRKWLAACSHTQLSVHRLHSSVLCTCRTSVGHARLTLLAYSHPGPRNRLSWKKNT